MTTFETSNLTNSPLVYSELNRDNSITESSVTQSNCAIRTMIRKKRLGSINVHKCGLPIFNRVHLNCSTDSEGQRQMSFNGIQTCKSKWICPVCRSKAMKERQNKLTNILNEHLKYNENHSAYLITLTFSHHKGERLNDLLGSYTDQLGLSGAIRHLQLSRGWKSLYKDFGALAYFRVLEVTYSDKNGFHPHYHLLILTDKTHSQSKIESFQHELFNQWSTACYKAKIGAPSLEHGVDVRGGENASYYVTKLHSRYGLSKEVTNVDKVAKNGNYSISQLEMNLLSHDTRVADHATQVLKEYYSAVKGRRVISGSTGLASYVNSEAKEPTPDTIVTVSSIAWKSIRERSLSGLLRLHYKNFGLDGVRAFFDVYFDDNPEVIFTKVTPEMIESERVFNGYKSNMLQHSPEETMGLIRTHGVQYFAGSYTEQIYDSS